MKTKSQSLSSNSGSDIEKISEIVEFFEGCNVLLTGGSGFVGKLLIEKILRSCPNIKKLYVILRGKKGKSPVERFKELMADALFIKLKNAQPNFDSKVVMIEGGLDESGLTLSPENRELIKDSHIVFHGAATVRFDDKLRFAVNVNVRGTKEILLLCRQMPNLKAIVHIGTAFSQCINQFIDEVFYEPPIDCDKILGLLDLLNDEQLEAMTDTLMGEWPNTYAYTKSIAEDVVLKYSKELPVCIVRPSIMIPTERSPIPGWINNIYGPTGVAVGAMAGVLHTLHGRRSNVADIIPADYVINNIIASAWDIGTTWRVKSMKAQLETLGDEEEIVKEDPPIYNCVTSIQNPITWGNYMNYNEYYGLVEPTMNTLWYYFFLLTPSIWMYKISQFLFHILPAIILDTIAWVAGRKPMLLKTYKKIHKFSTVISYFCMHQWKFRNDNVLKLWDKMSPIDREMFFFHVGEFEWFEYFFYHVRGIRTYLLKDPLSTLDRAKARFFWLKIAHHTLRVILSLILLWLIFLVFLTLYSYIFS